MSWCFFFFFQAEDGIRDYKVTGVQTCALPIFGHVGAVAAGCLASLGHRIVGVDIDAAKVRALAEGRSPVAEPGVEGLLQAAIAAGRLRATGDAADAVAATELSLVCVGTPGGADGDVDLRQVVAVSRD